MDKPIRILVFQRIFSHYRRAFYEAVSQKTDLMLLHGTDKSGIMTSSAHYSRKTGQIQIAGKDLVYYKAGFNLFNRVDVIVLDFAVKIVNLPFWMMYCKLKGKKVLLWSHGYNRGKGFNPSRSFADWYRKLLINYSDGLMVYSESDRKYLESKNINRRIFVINNTLDSDLIESVKNHYRSNDVADHTESSPEYNLVFLGRMIGKKNPLALIRIFDSFSPEVKKKVIVHFIGDGPELGKCIGILRQHPFKDNFIFHGSLYDEMDIGRIMTKADLVIIPGEAGLSVNHSLLYDVPVATFSNVGNGPFHGPEIEHIIQNKTGFLVPENDFDQLSKVVQKYLCNTELKKKMKGYIQDYADQKLRIGMMTEKFINSIKVALETR